MKLLFPYIYERYLAKQIYIAFGQRQYKFAWLNSVRKYMERAISFFT